MALETPEIYRYGKSELMADRRSAQIQIVASGGPSKVATAPRGRSISIWWGRGAPWGAPERVGVVKKPIDPPWRAAMVPHFLPKPTQNIEEASECIQIFFSSRDNHWNCQKNTAGIA